MDGLLIDCLRPIINYNKKRTLIVTENRKMKSLMIVISFASSLCGIGKESTDFYKPQKENFRNIASFIRSLHLRKLDEAKKYISDLPPVSKIYDDVWHVKGEFDQFRIDGEQRYLLESVLWQAILYEKNIKENQWWADKANPHLLAGTLMTLAGFYKWHKNIEALCSRELSATIILPTIVALFFQTIAYGFHYLGLDHDGLRHEMVEIITIIIQRVKQDNGGKLDQKIIKYLQKIGASYGHEPIIHQVLSSMTTIIDK